MNPKLAVALFCAGVLGWILLARMNGLDGSSPGGMGSRQGGAELKGAGVLEEPSSDGARRAVRPAADVEGAATGGLSDDGPERHGFGRIVDRDGAPVPECDVGITSYVNFRRSLSYLAPLLLPRTVTDARGEFRLRLPTPGPLDEWKLRASKLGYTPTLNHVSDSPGSSDTESSDVAWGDIVITRGVPLRGVVLGPGGQPVRGALISPMSAGTMPLAFGNSRGGHGEAIATSDRAGSFSIDGVPTGAFAFAARHPDFQSAEFAGYAELGVPAPDLVIRMGAALSVSGVVRGLPVDRGELTVSVRPQREMDRADEYGYDTDGRRFPIGSDGRFTATGVAPEGKVWLDVWTGTYAHMRSERRSARASAVAGDSAVVLDYSPGFDVRFRVLREGSGEPVEAITPIVEFGEGWNELTPPQGAQGHPPFGWPLGEVLAKGLVAPRAGMPLSVHVLSRGASLNMQVIEYPAGSFPGGLLDLGDLLLPAPRLPASELPLRARVAVLYPDGSPVTHAGLLFIPPVEWLAHGREGTAETLWRRDSNGCFEVRTTESGSAGFGLSLVHVSGGAQPGVTSTLNQGAVEPIWVEGTLSPGSTAEIVLPHPARYELTLRVMRDGEPAAGVQVSLHSFGLGPEDLESGKIRAGVGRANVATLDATGELRIPHLLPGPRTLTIQDPAGAALVVRAFTLRDRDEELNVILNPTAVHGRVTDESGAPLAGALVALLQGSRDPAFLGRLPHRTRPDGRPQRLAESASSSKLLAVTDSGGRYLFRVDIPDATDWKVVATAPDAVYGVSDEVRLGASRVDVPDLALRRSGSLRVTLPASEAPLDVAVGPAGQSAEDAFQGEFDVDFRDGSALCRGLLPGQWVVYRLSPSAESYGEALKQSVEVVAGETVELMLGK